MYTITITTYYLKCPNCEYILHKGRRPRNFGPGRICCSKCSTVFNSTLQDWKELSVWEKIWAAVAELILPSSMEKMDPNHVAAFILFVVPCMLPFSPILLIISAIRLGKMIRESNKFYRTRIPPVW